VLDILAKDADTKVAIETAALDNSEGTADTKSNRSA
jgi:hypothetical protein